MSSEDGRPPMVLVTWEDASQMDDGVWVENSGDHPYKPFIHSQVGFLLSKSRSGVVLASTWSKDLVSARDSIPMKMVKSIQYLEPAKKPARKMGAKNARPAA